MSFAGFRIKSSPVHPWAGDAFEVVKPRVSLKINKVVHMAKDADDSDFNREFSRSVNVSWF